MVHPNPEGISQVLGMKGEVAHHQKVESEGEYFMLHIITFASFDGGGCGACYSACGILIPQPRTETEPGSPQEITKSQSLDCQENSCKIVNAVHYTDF